MKKYPPGTVRDLLATDEVTEPTKRALQKRLRETENYAPRFFSQTEFVTLDAVCRRLIPQAEVFCARFIDRNFSEDKSDGWRYDELPPDAETFRRGLEGINETAKIECGAEFLELSDARKDEILTAVQSGKSRGETWKTLNAKLFFEELLAQTIEVFYAHPLAQEQIGYVGMADAAGWTRIKLNELERREPRPIE